MAHFEKDEGEMLPETGAQQSDEVVDSNFRRLVSRKPSASISIPMASLESYEETRPVKHTNPPCSVRKSPKFLKALYGDAKGFGRKLLSFCSSYVPGVMNPHARLVRQWNKIFCLVAIFVDPLFFFLIYVKEDDKCIAINWTVTTTLVVFRSINDLIYFFHILLQFRLAYVSPESRVVGAGDLVYHPKKIALNYLRGYFFLDLFVVFPFPQIMILFVLPNHLGASEANYAIPLLGAVMLVQYFLRLFMFLRIGWYPTGHIYLSSREKIITNLLIFIPSSHFVGSLWYLVGLQRVNQCLQNACHNSNVTGCSTFIGCSHGRASEQESDLWNNNVNGIACFNSSSSFQYGIYEDAVPLTTDTRIVNKYVQIISLADNLTPNYNYMWEVVFTMAIMGLGLAFFALLIGNIQNLLQARGSRRLEMEIRDRNVEEWMIHRRIPEELRRRIQMAERYNQSTAWRVHEEMLMENLPEDLQIDIRRHLFKFVKKIRIFALLHEPILDAICERLKQKTYIKGSKILTQGGLLEKMVFVVRGKLESRGEDGFMVPLTDGDACGEELLTWYLEHSSVSTDGKKVRLPKRVVSTRTVTCLTNVEAISLRLADLEDLSIHFPGFFQDPRIQQAIRYESPYWRSLAATRIQVAWRYRKKRLSRVCSSPSD